MSDNLDESFETPDPRLESLLFIRSPLPVCLVIAAYLIFVLGGGQRWMKTRKAYDLRIVMNVYNLTQMFLNAYLFHELVLLIPHLIKFNFLCLPLTKYDFSEVGDLSVKNTYLYFFVKTFDLLDTIFFILRKKNNQVTFLHVYHHTGIVFGTYYYIKTFSGGGFAIVVGFCNCFVHFFMYGYYLAASYNDGTKKNIWWKKHITQMQIIQFLIYIAYSSLSMFLIECEIQKTFYILMLVQAGLMTVLFSNFYYRAYIKKKAID